MRVGDVAHANLEDAADLVGRPGRGEHGRPGRVERFDEAVEEPQVRPAPVGDVGGLGHVLVADAPNHERGVVPIASDAALEAGEGRADPFGVVDVVRAPVDGQLLQEVDAHLVAEAGELVVAEEVGAYGVDVGLLHEVEASPQPRFGRVHPVLGVIGEVVDAAELDGVAVELRPVGREVEPAKAGAVAEGLPGLPGGGELELDGVEVGEFVVPQRRPRDGGVEVDVLLPGGGNGDALRRVEGLPPVAVEKAQPQRRLGGRVARVSQRDRAVDAAGVERFVELHAKRVFRDRAGLDGVQAGRLREARELDGVPNHVHLHVLVPTEEPHGDDRLFARREVIGRVDFDGRQTAAVVGQQRAVDVHPPRGVDRLEPQPNPLARPRCGDGDATAEHRAVVLVDVRERDAVPVGHLVIDLLRLGVGVEDLARLLHTLPQRVVGGRCRELRLVAIERPTADPPLAVERQHAAGVIENRHETRRRQRRPAPFEFGLARLFGGGELLVDQVGECGHAVHFQKTREKT